MNCCVFMKKKIYLWVFSLYVSREFLSSFGFQFLAPLGASGSVFLLPYAGGAWILARIRPSTILLFKTSLKNTSFAKRLLFKLTIAKSTVRALCSLRSRMDSKWIICRYRKEFIILLLWQNILEHYASDLWVRLVKWYRFANLYSRVSRRIRLW